MNMSKEKKLQIRNSTAEFLIFTRQAGEDGIEVRVAEETVWLTQKLISVLFDKGRSTITEHLKNIFETGELDEKAVCRDFRHTAEDGKDYTTLFYSLDAIIAVGFRVNSARAIQFRQWATGVLRDFAIRGYALDKERLKNGSFFNKAYFDNLLEEIREIRASERKFYQKITDIYATAMALQHGSGNHADVFRHGAEQAPFRHSRAHRLRTDRGAGGQQEGEDGLDHLEKRPARENPQAGCFRREELSH